MLKNNVSVIIPAFNAEKTLKRAFLSTLEQGIDNEVIIINDKSSDKTLEIANYLADKYKNIIVLDNEVNIGVSATRNRGISIAKGEYVAFLDADDIWLPLKLQKQLEVFKLTPNCVLVSCDCLQVSPSGKALKRGHINKPPVTGTHAWITLLKYNFMPTPTVVTKTDLALKFGGFDQKYKIAEDLDLWIKIAKEGSVAIVEEVLVHYFDYDGSLMKVGEIDPAVVILNMLDKHVKGEARISKKEYREIYKKRYYDFAIQNHNNYKKSKKYIDKSITCGLPLLVAYNFLIRSYFNSHISRVLQWFKKG
ncbi:hypothetical protein CMT41_18200 [Colwellia sp. MT41]|nr:hypothetical protein CMT41_18200 [Colwellia sp. MT41]